MMKHHYVTSADLFKLHCQPESNLYRNDDTETLLDATKEVCFEVNTVKAKYIFLFYHQNAGQNQNINITNKQSRNVVKLKCFKTTSGNQKYCDVHTVGNMACVDNRC
jgi:hypothetical protein